MNRNYVIVSLMDRLFVSMPRDSYCVSHTALYRQGLIAPDPTFTASRLRDAWALWFRQHHPEKDRLIQNLEARGTFLDLEVYAFFPEMYKVAVLMDHLVWEEGEWVYRTAEATGEIYGTDLPDWQATAWRFLYHHEEEHMYVPIKANEAPQGLLFTKNQLKLIDDEYLVRFTKDIQDCTGSLRHGEPADRMWVRHLMVPHAKSTAEILQNLQSGHYRKKKEGKATKVDGEDLPESEPKRPRPNGDGEAAAGMQGYVMHWPGVVGAFVPGDSSELSRAINPTVCVHCLIGLPHRHSNAQRSMGLLDPKTSVSGEPRNSGLELVFDEDCIDNPLLLQADYAEVNALWYSALDDQQDLTASLAKWREFFRAQWLEMTDEQKILYLMSRKARPLILRARAEPAWWPRDDKDKDGPPVLVAGGGKFNSASYKMEEVKDKAKDFNVNEVKLTKIDHFDSSPCLNPLIKDEKQYMKSHHDDPSPVLPGTHLSSPDEEIWRPAKALNLLKVVTPVSNDTVLLIFLLKKKKINC